MFPRRARSRSGPCLSVGHSLSFLCLFFFLSAFRVDLALLRGVVEGEIELAGNATEGGTRQSGSAVVPLARGVDDGVALVAPSIVRRAGRPVRVRGDGGLARRRVLPEPRLVHRGGARVAPRLRQAQPARTIAAGCPRQRVLRRAVDGRDRGPDLRAEGGGLVVGDAPVGPADERGVGGAVRAGQGVEEERHYSGGAHRRRPCGG